MVFLPAVLPAALGGVVMRLIYVSVVKEPPDDAAVVVRGGSMKVDFVRRRATVAYERLGVYAISVFLALDESVGALCRREPRLRGYGKIRLSSVDRLRAAAFVLLPTFTRPHYSIVLSDLSESSLDRLEVCFDAPITNPGRA